MTTATSARYFAPASTSSNPLLAFVSVLLGISLRESLATGSPAQPTDAAFAWGM